MIHLQFGSTHYRFRISASRTVFYNIDIVDTNEHISQLFHPVYVATLVFYRLRCTVPVLFQEDFF